MFDKSLFRIVRGKPPADDSTPLTPVDRRREERVPVFREVELTIEGCYRIRAVITDLGVHGARIAYATRIDLPGRIVLCEPTLNIRRWARVMWQEDGVAGIEFQERA